jgi:phage terminase Nu1 subunit (DNA packaging protein)
MNTDSAKNANTPSIASAWPITPPAKLEKPAQLVPNWDSSGIPVTTRTAKLTAKIFAPEVSRSMICRSLRRILAQEGQAAGFSAEERNRLQPRDEQGQPHRENGEQIVEHDHQRELPTIDGDVASQRAK